MDTGEETRSARVPEKAIPDEEAQARRQRWAWVEPSVWTDRMLAALENGVQKGKWFSRIDKVHRKANLASAFREVKRNGGAAGVDHVSVAAIERDLDGELTRLSEALRTDTWQPQAARRVFIDKPGTREKRPLGIPTVRDRVCEGAVRHVLEPIFEPVFDGNSFGFRPGRGAKDALRAVDRELKAGNVYVVDADIKRYFDTIPHERRLARVSERISDGRVMAMLEALLKRGVLEGRDWQATETGTPQGGVIGPLLANVYLHPLDQAMRRAGYTMIRCADDLVILCVKPEDAAEAQALLRAWVEEQGLVLHPVKTRIVNLNEPGQGFDFLGYHVERTRRGKLDRWPRRKSLAKRKTDIRAAMHRANGKSLPDIIATVNRTTRGWYEYFKHSNIQTFPELDGWIRGRLRAILRKRAGLRGRGRGRDHHRWNNAYFAAMGYFSLTDTRRAASQSA